MAAGQYEEAAEDLVLALTPGGFQDVADTLRTLGAVRLKQGNVPGGMGLLSESLELARSVEDKRGIAETVQQTASAAAARQE